MSEIINKQIEQLLKLNHEVCDDGIIFKRKNVVTPHREKTVVFENYIINPFPGFDLHEKWNNGIAPPSKIMYGDILKETTGMYYLSLHTETDNQSWQGWCPKKSCHIKE